MMTQDLKTILSASILLPLCLMGTLGCSNTKSNKASENTAQAAFAFKNMTIASLGDSVSVGVSAARIGESSPESSWSTGTSLPGEGSHFQRLERLGRANDFEVHPLNLAQPFAEIVTSISPINLQSQAERLSQQLVEEDFNYVTLFIGSNDACTTQSSLQVFRESIEARTQLALRTIGPKSDLIVVASVPDLNRLLNTPSLCLWGSFVQSGARQLACPNANRADFEDYVMAANDGIESAINASPYPVLFDGRAVNTAYMDGSLVASDCFHPSVSGQLSIADTLWPTVEKALSLGL